jgi:hypothetical protein
MSAAALNYEPQETLLVSDGGIASFLTATVGDWAEADDENIPHSGIAQVKHVADRLAEYGRHEDEYMVHAAEGETVIPMAVLEANPRLRKSLFAQMEAMGLDPERYVVGSELNSINPVTGQPEFFLKKLFKGVKKLVKKVVKVVKKALPVVLPIALSFTPLGTVYGAALGSGIGTLMKGGSFKDALKAAVISGGIGGLASGMSGGVQAVKSGTGTFGEGFMSGARGAFGNVGERFGQALGGARPEGASYFGSPFRPIEAPDLPPTGAGVSDAIQNQIDARVDAQIKAGLPQNFPTDPLRQGFVTVEEMGTAPFTPSAGAPPQAAGGRLVRDPSKLVLDPEGILSAGTPAQAQALTAGAGPAVPDVRGQNFIARMQQSAGPGQFDSTTSSINAGVDQNILDPLRTRADSNIAQRGYDYLTAGGKTPAELAQAAADAKANAMQRVVTDYGFGSIGEVRNLANAGLPSSPNATAALKEAIAAGNAAAGASGPGMLTRFGPSVALAGIGAAGAGFFDPPETEEEEEEDGFPKYDPEGYKKYMLDFPTAPVYSLSDIRVPGRPVGFAADGGGIASLEEFPRRSGAIAGPGTERSDDVPAMLSDGEFVMTAKAVRGAGNGSRNDGMRKMYQMMRTFEAVS